MQNLSPNRLQGFDIESLRFVSNFKNTPEAVGFEDSMSPITK